MRTTSAYGYGTRFLLAIEEGATSRADALARQETSNQIRHLRNETAHQMLRNGFVVLMIALGGFAFA